MDGPNWRPLWPDADYRKEFARSLHDYIVDKDRKYATAEPGVLGPGVPLFLEVQSYFSDCVKQFVDELLRRQQPSQQFGMEENYAMGRFLESCNEDPFNSIVLAMPRGSQSYEGALSGFSPSTAGDPRGPIGELHRRGTARADLYPAVFDLDEFPRGTHGANLAEQVETVTEIMSSRRSYVEPFHQDGGLTPLSQFPTIGSHNPGRSGGSALGRRQRTYSGGESTGAGSQTSSRRARTKRDQPPPKTAAGEAGQSSRNFGANARSVDESSRNTTGAGTVSKEGFKHKCKKCGERFEFPARLKSHMETITHAERRYRCDLCGAVFSRNSSLKRHQEAATACKSKVQNGNDSPPPSTSESGARDAAFRGARPPSMASPSHGNVSPSVAGNQSVSSQNQYRPFGPASGPRTSLGGGSHFPQMAGVPSQQHRSLQPSVASRSSHRPSSAHSYINPRMLQETNDGYNDCD